MWTPDMQKWFSDSQAKLTKAQRRLARKHGSSKGERKSHNWRKQMRKVAKIQRHIAAKRNDLLHKESKRLVGIYDLISIEDLSIKEMSVEYTDVDSHKTEHNINKAILNAGWYRFTQMLDYKAKEQGCKLIKVGKYFPSTKTCSVCGHVDEPKAPGILQWICPKCNTLHDRDINAAINIRNEGLRLYEAS